MADPGDATRLEENLSALASRQPSLAASVRSAAADPRIAFLTARNGATVPVVRSAGGTVPLHSLYDPRQESVRLAGSLNGCGFLVVSGLGGGFHVAAMLDDPGVRGVVVIEKSIEVLRSLFALAPLAGVLDDPRVTISAGPVSIRETILGAWLPAVMGGMKAVELRPWREVEKAFFDAASVEIGEAVDLVRRDYSVQSHFGKRWLANILLNCPRAESAPREHPGIASAAVTAAGPSLEQQLPRLAAVRGHVFLVATDASLPALLRSGIRPDAVLSIDCQNHGYHHFLQGMPEETALFLDLASPPLLARRYDTAVFVASAHPLVRYMSSHWRPMVPIDTSGGNVTHAAVSLAVELGASSVAVYGADFCYPGGKPYARGTWLYDVFRAGEDRLHPAEAGIFSFAQGSTQAHRTVIGRRVVYTTPLLTGYRQRFSELMESTGAEILPAAGGGLDLPRQARRATGPSRPPTDASRHRSPPGGRGLHGQGWKEFLTEYGRAIEQLPSLDARSTGAAKELWATILPVAARVVREGSGPGPLAVEEARRWTLERIARVLHADDGAILS